MLRRTVVPLVAAVVLSPLTPVGPAQASAARTVEPAVATAKAAKPSKACRARTATPRRAIAPKKFAKCALTALRKGRTVRIRTAYDDGTWAQGPYRFGKTTDASITHDDGSALIALGPDFWMKNPGEAWVKGKANGTPDEQVAHLAGTLWRATASPAHYRKVLASSSVKWRWTGVERKVNGVKARQYRGNPTATDLDYSEYSVWLDRNDRTVRVTSTGTAFGVTIAMTQDWRKWGKKVSIKAPKAG